jgi:hypothetical protein
VESRLRLESGAVNNRPASSESIWLNMTNSLDSTGRWQKNSLKSGEISHKKCSIVRQLGAESFFPPSLLAPRRGCGNGRRADARGGAMSWLRVLPSCLC